jgi:hypothetical protein
MVGLFVLREESGTDQIKWGQNKVSTPWKHHPTLSLNFFWPGIPSTPVIHSLSTDQTPSYPQLPCGQPKTNTFPAQKLNSI